MTGTMCGKREGGRESNDRVVRGKERGMEGGRGRGRVRVKDS